MKNSNFNSYFNFFNKKVHYKSNFVKHNQNFTIIHFSIGNYFNFNKLS